MQKLILIIAVLLTLCACARSGQPEQPALESNYFVITFDYEKQSGYSSNQFAAWIEDLDGTFIKTLYVTRFTAKGGYNNRPDSISDWVQKSGVAAMDKTGVEAVTGATPKAGELAYYWDLTDADGHTVPQGTYRFVVEGSLRWRNRVVYSGEIEIGGAANEVTAQTEYFYEQAADNQPALTADSPENAMLGNVKGRYVP